MARMTQSRLMWLVEETWPSYGHSEIFAAMRVVIADAATAHIREERAREDVVATARGNIRKAMGAAMDNGVPPKALAMIVFLANTASRYRGQ